MTLNAYAAQAMENLDAAEVLEAGFAHERFWDVILGVSILSLTVAKRRNMDLPSLRRCFGFLQAVVAFVMEWQEVTHLCEWDVALRCSRSMITTQLSLVVGHFCDLGGNVGPGDRIRSEWGGKPEDQDH